LVLRCRRYTLASFLLNAILLLMILIDKGGSVLSYTPLALSCAAVRNVCSF
jgi:hypothetical protein